MDSRFLRHPAARRLGGPLALLLCLAGCALPGAPPPLLADSTREADAGEQDGEGDVADPGLPGAGVAIVLDGRFQDWDPVAPACPERAGDGGPSGIDLSDLRVANTPERLHLLLDTGRVLELDTDNGLSLYLECGDRDEAGGSGLRWDPGLRSGSAWGPQGTRSISHADLGFVAMPTTTGSRFEATLERASLERLLGPGCVADSLRIRVADRSSATGDQAPDGGGWIRYRFSGDLVPPRPLPSLGRTPGTLRVVSWNVLWSGIVDPALEGPFRRVLQALDPDVVAL
ncbi:MAG: hypothetical protein FJ098_06365, partial [Deltaproteobacteria bacterium]|nr:hypothetical protein [Deltaproteobacteria bacterium]